MFDGPAKITEFRGIYRFLSNFWPCEVLLDGELYSSVEHAYQAAKTMSYEHRDKIRLAATAGNAKRMGRNVPMRGDWDSIKLQVMLDLLRRKFTHRKLAALLLETSDAELIEGNTWGDRFWGVCAGIGENHLGKLLMQVREEIRNGN